MAAPEQRLTAVEVQLRRDVMKQELAELKSRMAELRQRVAHLESELQS
jgi:polyhydroxyalkanoate synthesis regulator phasin